MDETKGSEGASSKRVCSCGKMLLAASVVVLHTTGDEIHARDTCCDGEGNAFAERAPDATRRVVINDCFGGFGLSRAAFLRLRELGHPEALAEDDPLSDGYVERAVARDGERFGYESTRKSAELCVTMFTGASPMASYMGRDLRRDDPLLVQVVEELGAEGAAGRCGHLKIVEIPADVEWEIDEYDGNEHIAEKHRVWR